jgi:hypothetical protein
VVVSAEGEAPTPTDPTRIDPQPELGGLVDAELPDPPSAVTTGRGMHDLLFVRQAHTLPCGARAPA